MVLPYAFDRISYARNLGYYKHKNMERSVKACHRLFGVKKVNAFRDGILILTEIIKSFFQSIKK